MASEAVDFSDTTDARFTRALKVGALVLLLECDFAEDDAAIYAALQDIHPSAWAKLGRRCGYARVGARTREQVVETFRRRLEQAVDPEVRRGS